MIGKGPQVKPEEANSTAKRKPARVDFVKLPVKQKVEIVDTTIVISADRIVGGTRGRTRIAMQRKQPGGR
jgi:hypothetical protein